MQTDEQLALGVQRGRQEDLNMLFERHYRPLLGYLYRMCNGLTTLAEDLAQETFVRMMRGITSYEPSRPFKPWLYSIATNIVRNHYRSADVRYADNAEDESAEWIADDMRTEEAFILREEAQTVLHSLSQLPDHQREVVVLYFYQELPQKDIADILRIPIGTVKSRLSLGLRRLRDIIQEMEGNHESLR